MTHHCHPINSERGFSMVLVLLTLFAASTLVAGAFALANDDLPLAAGSRDSKISYAAAEAGLNFYLTRLNQDNDYWSKCENVDPPKTGEPNPVNKVWNGTAPDPRTWRNVTGSTSQYTLELLPAAGQTKHTACDPTDQSSVLDASGTFRLRATGRPSATSTQRRSIIASFRPVGFLDFLYFTYYENLDPQVLPTGAARDWATENCAGKYRWERPSSCKSVVGGYNTEIQFVTGEQIAGPLRSNDSLLICGTPTFGRSSKDAIEPRTTAQYAVADDHCTNGAVFKGKRKPHDDITEPPSSNSELQPVAAAGGYVFKGKTLIRLTGDTMTVTNKGTTTSKALPANGVIYVAPDPSQGPCQPIQYPVKTAYDEDAGCANVYVSGTYSRSLTIAAGNDVIVAPTTAAGTIDWSSADRGLTRGNDNALLGLIANNFVRVGHKVTRTSSSCSNSSSAVDDADLTIQAAILSLQHSFIVDNYTCGDALGDLYVYGAIAQRYRGAVGTSASTGFKKQYTYDDRLQYRSPPYFMKPIDSPWKIVRAHEQVPAR